MLQVDGIDAYYGDLQALSDVSLALKKGEMVALIGSNGAGKSTLLRTAMGLIRPTKGNITFNSLPLNKKATHEIVEAGICAVPEGRGLFSKMSVLENLEMGAFTHRARGKKEKNMVEIFGMFPILRNRKNQMVWSLSGGEQQMLAIGKGLMSCPELLLLDEVSLGLAPLIVRHIFQIIKQINEAGVSILIVEQNVYMALGMANRGYVIENGHITGHGEAASLLSDDRIKKAYLGQG